MMVVRGWKRMGFLFNGYSLFYKMKLWGWVMVARDRITTKMYIKNKLGVISFTICYTNNHLNCKPFPQALMTLN